MMIERNLPNGVRLMAEQIPHVKTVALGLWFSCGSRHESADIAGASHFLEHMLFKGTSTHTAQQIAELSDALGGQLNAFTTKECTCYYTRVLSKNVKQSADLLADMLLNSRFDALDIEAERRVIFEEIDMYEDAPDDLVSEQINQAVFGANPVGHPILGNKKTLGTFDRDVLMAYRQAHYTAENLVIAMSGNFADDDIDHLSALFGQLPTGKKRVVETPTFTPSIVTTKKDIEQNHLVLLFPGLTRLCKDRYGGFLLTQILGGGMSSRLFQTVRETAGLCYSIYAFGIGYTDSGLFGVYTATSPKTEKKAVNLIVAELEKMCENGPTAEELDRVREQIKTNFLMSLESTASRMNFLGKNMLFRGEIPTVEQVIARYDEVTVEQVGRLARQVINREQLAFSAVGNVQSREEYRQWIQ